MKIVSTNIYVGPNIYAHFPVIRHVLDLGELEEWPTAKLGDDYIDRLLESLPGLHEHGCSYREPGGFVRRMREDEGTWLGHVMEHVAIELQNVAGSAVTFGRTRSIDGQPGHYNMVFQYKNAEVGREASQLALALIHSLLPDDIKPADAPDNEWSFRRPEPQLEVEMLSRLMVYLGLDQESITAQFDQPKLFQPRASLQLDAEEKSSYLLLKDPYQIAWNRLNHVLRRMNFEILVSEFKSGFSSQGVFVVKSNVVETVQDEGFFGIGGSEKNISRNFNLILSEDNHETTRVIIEDDKGNFDSTPEGAEFLSLLFEQLK